MADDASIDVDGVLARGEDIKRQLSLIPSDQIWTKRIIARAWMLSQITLFILVAGLLLLGLQIRHAVRTEIPGLKEQVADRDETISDQEDIINQSVDAVVQLLDLLKANGIEPPQIRIQPQDLKGNQPS